jgi:hypothetical protein
MIEKDSAPRGKNKNDTNEPLCCIRENVQFKDVPWSTAKLGEVGADALMKEFLKENPSRARLSFVIRASASEGRIFDRTTYKVLDLSIAGDRWRVSEDRMK